METDDAVEKQRTVFPQHLAKRCCVSHSFHRPGGDQTTNEQNNKTGHFTCYKNRTFSFATDTQLPLQPNRSFTIFFATRFS